MVVVEAELATVVAVGLAEGSGREGPLVQGLASDPERVLQALSRPRHEPVERHRDPEPDLRHALRLRRGALELRDLELAHSEHRRHHPL